MVGAFCSSRSLVRRMLDRVASQRFFLGACHVMENWDRVDHGNSRTDVRLPVLDKHDVRLG